MRTRNAATLAAAAALAAGLGAGAVIGCGSQPSQPAARPPATAQPQQPARPQQQPTGIDAVNVLKKITGIKMAPGNTGNIDVNGVPYADGAINRPGMELGPMDTPWTSGDKIGVRIGHPADLKVVEPNAFASAGMPAWYVEGDNFILMYQIDVIGETQPVVPITTIAQQVGGHVVSTP